MFKSKHALSAVTVAALSLVFTDPASADDRRVTLDPVSPWNLDAADDGCRLSRVFGGEGNLHMLIFEQAGPGASPGMTVAGPALKKLGSMRGLKIGLGKGEALRDVTQFYRGSLDTVGPAAIYSSIPIAAPSSDGESDD